MEQADAPGRVDLADRGLAVYRLVQVARAFAHPVVARLSDRVARRLLKTVRRRRLASGTECPVAWNPERGNQLEPGLPTEPVVGRLVYVRVNRQGFRPQAVYLFTTLLDRARYPLAEIVAVYGERWDGELDYRHVKTTLEMGEFDVKSAALFRKELAAGLLTYNLICAYMVKAALKAGLAPTELSFSRCARRLRDLLQHGVPSWVAAEQVEAYLVERLAKCRLPQQPHKVAHEPRRVRYRPKVFPALKGSRNQARRQINRVSTSNTHNS